LPYLLSVFFLGLILTSSYYEPIPGQEILNGFEVILGMCDGEVFLELGFLIIGWCCLFVAPGLAAIRCFRVFRLMWYFELFPFTEPEDYDPSEHLFSFRKASQLCLLYMERLGTEIVTSKSRGATVVLAMFFYCTYVLAVVFWNEAGHLVTPEGETCVTLVACFITLMRLAFYDGTGFDYLTAVIDAGYGGYGALLIFYMIATAIILLNGLIGIFGDSFSADEEDDDDKDKKSVGSVGDRNALNAGEVGGGVLMTNIVKVSPRSEQPSDEAVALLKSLLHDVGTLNKRLAVIEDKMSK